MALTASDIERVLRELAPAVTGGWIQKIFQPGPLTVVLEIRAPGQTHRVLISCEPETARIHLLSRPLQNPAQPPAFCQFLRARIQGGRVNALQQVPSDRIVSWHLTTKEGDRQLVCELTGARANVLLVDAAGSVLRDLRRGSASGQPYAPPARRIGRPAEPGRFAIEAAHGPFPLSAAIEAFYHGREAEQVSEQAKATRLRTLRAAVKKEQRRLDAWRGDAVKAAAYRDYGRYGELLKANLGAMKKGMARLTVVDYYDERLPDVTLPLDAAKSAQGNMDDYFRKHRKYLRAQQELTPRIAAGERLLETLHAEIAAIEQDRWTPPPPAAFPSRRAPTDQTRRPDEDRPRGPFRRFVSADGRAIFVGRNARENDELTFGLAKSDDLWLHARGAPGSHVVVRLDKGAEPAPDTLRDAAVLALLYSDLKKSGKGEVIYTRRKWVKKAKGQAPGAVLVTQEQSLHVTLDKARLDALKRRALT
jgi:predicted ribosome quality control (RQC) complex YloA/Tae2 family protein